MLMVFFQGDNCEEEKPYCGGTFDAENGTLVFPTVGTMQSQQNLRCYYTLKTVKSKDIAVSFEYFDLNGTPGSCTDEFLQEVLIGSGENGPSFDQGVKLCGSEVPPNATSVGHTMNLRLMTNGQDRLRRFKLNWVSVEPDCGGFVRGSHGTITSPNYPNGYPHNRDCLWKIIGERGKRIQV